MRPKEILFGENIKKQFGLPEHHRSFQRADLSSISPFQMQIISIKLSPLRANNGRIMCTI